MLIKTHLTHLKLEELKNHALNLASDESVQKLKQLLEEQKKPDVVVSFNIRVVRNMGVVMFLT